MQYVTFRNGEQLPIIGMGVYRISDEQMDASIASAYENGYRHFDTAEMYFNEAPLGRAWRKLGVDRSQIQLTTKIDNIYQGYEKTLKAFNKSLQDLQTDYVDQLLIHWPGQDAKRTESTWKAFEKLYEEGLVKIIGVSNFTIRHIEIIEKSGNIPVMSNQIERHPFFTEHDLLPLLKAKQIIPIAWAPLKRGSFESNAIKEIAKNHNKTIAQIILRWNVQSGVIAIPKSINGLHQKENIDVFDFTLSPQEIETIEACDQGERTSFDPDTFDF